MPSFTSDYVQWQTARRQAAQAARDAAIDIIEHYNRATGSDDDGSNSQQLSNYLSKSSDYGQYDSSFSVNATLGNRAAGKTGEGVEKGKGMTTSPRSKKSGAVRVEYMGRQGGVFTEGISSLSRRSNFPLALQRTDIVKENLPDTVKVAREKSRIYFAFNHSSSSHSKNVFNKGDLSAKSTKTLPPPSSSHPFSDMLSVADLRRSKTFHQETVNSERAALSTRSTLDSRGTVVTDILPVRHQRPPGTRYMRYPSSTGAPPSTPMTRDYFVPSNTPHLFGAERSLLQPSKPPSVSIVSFGGDSVEQAMRQEGRPRLPVPFRSLPQDLGLTGKGTVGTMTNGNRKSSSKPGIDLPYLPLRAADAGDTTFQHTPRGRPSRMNYTSQSSRRSRRRFPAGYGKQLRTDVESQSAERENGDKDGKEGSSVRDPYSDRFRQSTTVSSVYDVYIPAPPPASAASHHPDSDTDDEQVGKPELSIMLTVQEEEEGGGDKGSKPTSRLASLPEGGNTNGEAAENGSPRGQSEVSGGRSNKSRLSVPLLSTCVDLSEARPPPLLPEVSGEVCLTINIPTDTGLQPSYTSPPPASRHSARASGEEDNCDPRDSPAPIAGTSVLNTARTIATQTSLPYDPDSVEERPRVVKVKTLSMFPDIVPPASPPGLYPADTDLAREGLLTATSSDPVLKDRMGKKTTSSVARSLLLPELQRDSGSQSEAADGELTEGEGAGERDARPNTVKNITFISPLEIQQNAKRC